MKLKIPKSKPVSELDEIMRNASIAGRYRKLRTAFNELLKVHDELCHIDSTYAAYSRKDYLKKWKQKAG